MSERRRVDLATSDIGRDAYGKPKVVTDFSLWHGLFTFSIPPQMWIITEDEVEAQTSTEVLSEDGMAKISCTANNGEIRALVSKRHPRYQPNRGQNYASSMFLPDLTALAIRDFGLLGHEDGVFFRLKSDGILYACLQRDDVLTKEEAITIDFTVDLEKGNLYDIQYQWRGVGNYKFYISNPETGQSQLVHEFSTLGELTETSTQNAALPLGFRIESTGEAAVMYCGCADVSSEGGNADILQYQSTTGNEITVTDAPILAIRKPSLYNGKINTRDIILGRITIHGVKKSHANIYVTRDATALTISTGAWEDVGDGTVEAFKPVNAADSSLDANKANIVIRRYVGAGTEVEIDNPLPNQISFFLTHGDYLVITGEAATGEMQATIEWGDEI